MVGRGAPEPKRSWRADKTLLARQAHRSENPPASAVGSVNIRTKNVVQCIIKEGKMSFSIRMTTEERNLAESYARLHSMSLGEAFKKALFEQIEDEYDIAVANEAYEEYVKSGKKSRPISELWKELEL